MEEGTESKDGIFLLGEVWAPDSQPALREWLWGGSQSLHQEEGKGTGAVQRGRTCPRGDGVPSTGSSFRWEGEP